MKIRNRRRRLELLLLSILGAAILVIMVLHYTLRKNNNQNETAVENGVFSPIQQRRNKYMIYICDGSFLCGGWADRLKGIVATYLIANATNRRFGIHMAVPCDLSKYLLPNLIDWRIDKSRLYNDTQVFIAMSDSELLKYSHVMNLDEMFPHSVTYFAYNLDIVPYLRHNKLYSRNLQWTIGMETHEIYSLIYKSLFQFSPLLEEKLQNFRLNYPVGTSLMCAQVRLGRNPSNSKDTEVRSRYSDVTMIWDFFRSHISNHRYRDNHNHYHHDNHHHSHHTDNFRIFVTSDSEQVRSDASSLFPKYTIDLPGDLVHIERSTKSVEHMCEGLGKVLLDQIILASCEVLVISKSGFGEISSFLRGRDSNLYCFRYSRLYKCSMSNFDFDLGFVVQIAAVSFFGIVAVVLLLFLARQSEFVIYLK